MAFGIEIYDANGDVMLSPASAANFRILEKFSVTPTNLGGSGQLAYKTYPEYPNAKIMALSIPDFGNDYIQRNVNYWSDGRPMRGFLGQNTNYATVFHHKTVDIQWGNEAGTGIPFVDVRDGGEAFDSLGTSPSGNSFQYVENHYYIQYPPQTIFTILRTS